jgi:hypothetical protein
MLRCGCWVVAALPLLGCPRHYAIPGPAGYAEAPATLKEGEAKFGIGASGSFWQDSLKPREAYYHGVGTIGVAPHTDIQIAFSQRAGERQIEDDEWRSPVLQTLFRIKWSPEWARENVAFVGGLGLGVFQIFSASSEAGVILGFENRVAVPFVDVRATAATPLSPGHKNGPFSTIGYTAATGVEIRPFAGGRKGLALTLKAGRNEYWGRGRSMANDIVGGTLEFPFPAILFGYLPKPESR